MSKALTFILLLGLTAVSSAAVNEDITQIRYEVTAIEHQYATDQKKEKIQALEEVIQQAQNIIDKNTDKAEGYVWKGIALSAQAKHKAKGFGALSTAKRARSVLEKAIAIDPGASDAAACNALAMLYYKVPGWPVGFGNKDKAEEYFQKALSISSNLDTNYRYGEYLLVARHQREEGLRYLKTALSFPNRQGRKEEELKKKEIRQLLSKYQ